MEENETKKLFLEGLDLYKKQLYSEAARRWRAVVAMDPDFPNVQMYLNICERQELHDLQFLESVDQDQEEGSQVQVEVMDLVAECKQEFEAFLQDSKEEEALHCLNVLLSERPGDPSALVFLIHSYRKLSVPSKALEAASLLVKLEPFSARSHFLQGNIHFVMEKYQEAFACYKKALKLKPESFRLLYNVTLLCIARKDTLLAQDYLHRAKKLRPKDKALARLENVLRTDIEGVQGRLEKMKSEIEAGEGFPDQYYRLGLLQSRCGDQGGAYKSMQAALEANPDYKEAMYEKGRIEFELEEFEKSYETLQTLRDRVDPKLVQKHRGNIDSFASSGYLEEACALLLECLRLQPDFGAMHIELGKEYLKMDQLDKAKVELEKGRFLNPEYADGHFYYGLCQKLQGDLQAASDSFQEALDLNPMYTEAALELSQLLMESGKSKVARKILMAQESLLDSSSDLLGKIQKLLKEAK